MEPPLESDDRESCGSEKSRASFQAFALAGQQARRRGQHVLWRGVLVRRDLFLGARLAQTAAAAPALKPV
jgi:hypothetical protein